MSESTLWSTQDCGGCTVGGRRETWPETKSGRSFIFRIRKPARLLRWNNLQEFAMCRLVWGDSIWWARCLTQHRQRSSLPPHRCYNGKWYNYFVYWWMLVFKAYLVPLVNIIFQVSHTKLSGCPTGSPVNKSSQWMTTLFPMWVCTKESIQTISRQMSQRSLSFFYWPFALRGFSQQKPKAISQWGLRMHSYVSKTPTMFILVFPFLQHRWRWHATSHWFMHGQLKIYHHIPLNLFVAQQKRNISCKSTWQGRSVWFETIKDIMNQPPDTVTLGL